MIFTPGIFVPELQKWQPIETGAPAPVHLPRLTVATMNVWFGEAYFDERCRATLTLLESYRPDLIALQEVIPGFLDQVLETDWVQAAYTLSDIYGTSVDPYGVLILSRLPVLEWQLFMLPGSMGRDLVIARAGIQQTPAFASVHLESHSYSTQIRAEQLARIFPRLSHDQHVVLMGDFNFDSSWAENQNLDPAYQDVWPLLHTSEPGYTEDTEVNTMRLLHTGKHKQVRFDRILLRSEQSGWRAETIQLIGTEPIGIEMPNVFPSDHFGLFGTFAWQS